MRTDCYTKILLTVIAVCFVLHILKEYDFITSAHAETTSSAAVLNTQQTNVVDVRIVDGVGYNNRLNYWVVYDPH